MLSHRIGMYDFVFGDEAERLGVPEGTLAPVKLLKNHNQKTTSCEFYEPMDGEKIYLLKSMNSAVLLAPLSTVLPTLVKMLNHSKYVLVPEAVARIVRAVGGAKAYYHKPAYEKECFDMAWNFHKEVSKIAQGFIGKPVYKLKSRLLVDELDDAVRKVYDRRAVILHTQQERVLNWTVSYGEASYYAIVGIIRNGKLLHLIKSRRGVIPVLYSLRATDGYFTCPTSINS